MADVPSLMCGHTEPGSDVAAVPYHRDANTHGCELGDRVDEDAVARKQHELVKSVPDALVLEHLQQCPIGTIRARLHYDSRTRPGTGGRDEAHMGYPDHDLVRAANFALDGLACPTRRTCRQHGPSNAVLDVHHYEPTAT